MHYTSLILVACSSLVLATPGYHHHKGEWRDHPHHEPCTEHSSVLALTSASSAALPISMEPTATPMTSLSEAGIASSAAEPPKEESTSLPSPPASSAAAPIVVSTSKAAAPVVSKTSAAPPVASATSPATTGSELIATFTEYGAGDTFGSGNCNTDTAACGFYSSPGFNAAASQNLFGVGPGAGAGPDCGKCYKLTGKTNPYNGDAALAQSNSIIVKVNNLCPIAGNPLCNQTALTGTPGTTNQFGATVNFDLCENDGASAAMFAGNPSNVGVAKGTAVEVSCSEWTGTDLTKRWLGTGRM